MNYNSINGNSFPDIISRHEKLGGIIVYILCLVEFKFSVFNLTYVYYIYVDTRIFVSSLFRVNIYGLYIAILVNLYLYACNTCNLSMNI